MQAKLPQGYAGVSHFAIVCAGKSVQIGLSIAARKMR
jgi:hypothetical protein